MKLFQYKTRGNSTPQGKPRVYFCSHPKDAALYFDDISKEILEKQNCVIWYRDSLSDMSDEETFPLLQQMQLFVIPITLQFLTTSSRALEVELPYALQNHIPVLPLMQEPGLEELFNQKCGNLQFFMGLAYRAGIDAEINFTRAFSLIEGAANTGLPLAMEKLISMYKKGEGVERNPEAAVQWQQKLSAVYLEQYKTTGDLKNAHAYIDTLLSQRETLNEIQFVSEAVEVCRKAYVFCRDLYKGNQDIANSKYLITCCLYLGNDYKKEGHLIQAGALFQEAYELCQGLSLDTDTAACHQYNLLCLEQLASYYEAANDLQKALDYAEKAFENAKRLSELRQNIPDPAGTVQAGLLAKKYLENNSEALSEEERGLLEKTIQEGKEAEILLYDLKMYMVLSIISRYSFNGVSFAELLHLGRQALIAGAEKYGRSTGTDFINYVSSYLRQKYVQAIATEEREFRISVREIENIKKLKKVFSSFKLERKRDPLPEELAVKMNISLSELKGLLQTMQMLETINQEIAIEKQKEKEELGHLDTKQLLLQDEQARQLLTRQLSKLSSREVSILCLLYGLEGETVHSIQEASKILNLSENRIRQIENKALRKLQRPNFEDKN